MTISAARNRLVLLLVGALATALLVFATGPAPASAVGQQASQRTVLDNQFGELRSRVVGTFGRAGTVTGTFNPRRFSVNEAGNRLRVVGILRATMVRGSGQVVGTDRERVAFRVASVEGTPIGAAGVTADDVTAQAACDVLNLVLGPLDLDLLGLQVHLDRVVLNIVAQSGAGNLLGNLLCAVAGLLDGNALLTEIANILNSILAILRL